MPEGVDEVRRSLTEDEEAWERVEVEAERIVEAGNRVALRSVSAEGN